MMPIISVFICLSSTQSRIRENIVQLESLVTNKLIKYQLVGAICSNHSLHWCESL